MQHPQCVQRNAPTCDLLAYVSTADSLIDALTSYLRVLPTEEAALLMPDDIGALARVFPVLQRVEVVARASDPRLAHLDEQRVRGRAFRALRSFLMRVSRRALVVWFIDDLQWGDADSAEALFEVLRPPEAPPLLLLGTYRSDETEGSAFLTRWKELQQKHGVSFAGREVKVGPLTVEQCTQLVINLLGQDNEVIRRRAAEFAQETRGNPLLLIELVGCFDADTDSFEPVSLHEALARKLGRLPAEAGNLLEVVAVSGQALSLEEASRTAGHELLPVATLTRMRNERLLRQIGTEDRTLIDTYHDRVREAVLRRMEEGQCRSLHRSLAEVIEKDAGVSVEQISAVEEGELSRADGVQPMPRIYDLAYHFDAAGEKWKAWIYALLAAEQAKRQSALEAAAAMVRKSLCLNSHTSAVLPALVSGLRNHAAAVQHKDAHYADKLRSRAFRLAKWATRITFLFPTAYSHSLRERSLMLAEYGKTKKALKFADKSCAVAQSQNAKYEHALSLLVRGKLAKQLGLPEADEETESIRSARS